MKRLTNYEKHFQEEMEDHGFREAYEEEYARLKFAYQMMQLRKEKKLSQKELAKRLGTTQSVIARMETGQQNFTVDTLQKIAEALRRKLRIELV